MRNPLIEAKLAELEELASREGCAAVYTVAALLKDCYRTGQHKDLARHCNAFSQIHASAITGAVQPGGQPRKPS